MDKNQFENLALKEKVYLILEQGKAVSTRQFLFYQITLYGFSDYFAEIWYIPATNKIDKVELITLDEILQLYQNDFDISSLLN
jgi:hypothetical protein